MIESSAMHCPVCDGRRFKSGPIMFDDRYGEPNRYQLACCIDCGHLSTSPRLQESELPNLYGNYYPRKNIEVKQILVDAKKFQTPFGKLRRWWSGTDNQGQYNLQPFERMLDVGCGSGTSLLEAKAIGGDAYGIEADPNVRPIADALDLNIHFGRLQDQPFKQLDFHLIVLNQVIEHLPDPDEALCLLRKRLKPGGRMILVFPNIDSLWRRVSGKRWINWHIPYHLHHFNKPRFERMAKRCGLEMTSCRTITPNVWTVQQIRACYQPAKLGHPNRIWSVTSPSVSVEALHHTSSRKALLRAFIMTPIALLNRVIDGFRMGDSLLVELRHHSTP